LSSIGFHCSVEEVLKWVFEWGHLSRLLVTRNFSIGLIMFCDAAQTTKTAKTTATLFGILNMVGTANSMSYEWLISMCNGTDDFKNASAHLSDSVIAQLLQLQATGIWLRCDDPADVKGVLKHFNIEVYGCYDGSAFQVGWGHILSFP
jgi:hypothetical protein